MSGIDVNQAENQDKKYKETVIKVDKWLLLHKGETFDLDMICKHLNITKPDERHDVTKKLSYELKKGTLEKSNRIYRYIDNTLARIDWVNAPDNVILDIKFPRSHLDGDTSRFGFDGNVCISQGDIIVNAGVTNTGKTAFSNNFLFENMDSHHCILMGNEYGNGGKFRDRISCMKWGVPTNEYNQSKFELIERRTGWKDVVAQYPDDINIIDWLNIPDKFYLIGEVIEGIQSKLRKGIALINIQMDPSKLSGMGGLFSEHLASLVITMNFNLLYVKKAKAWTNGYNPNKRWYGFQLSQKGTAFSDIREVEPCKKCHASGKVGHENIKCLECNGTGYSDVESQ